MIPELSDDISPEKRALLRSNPKIWVRNALRHPIDPSRNYDFRDENGKPLAHVLDEKSWLHPEEWAKQLTIKLT